MSEPTVYIIDRVVLRPGCAQDFISAYVEEYVPRSRQRGLELDRLLVSPPVWIADESNVVTAVWAVAGPAGWWKAAIGARYDPESAEWWARMEPLILERTRSSAAETADVEALCRV